ncbi:MAG: YihY family inner membrane protein [Candidatus Cloacimonetes bacterium]|nr:YihY family inner membrane protein [Candidatus Cloacimonadota bacterium]
MKKGLQNFWKTLKILYAHFVEDQAYLRATGLSYITFLAFMPFIMVTFLFTPNITMVKIKDVFLNFIFETFIPKSAEILKEIFNDLLARRTGLDVIGIILLVITSFFLFKSISHTFSKILPTQKHKKRSVFRDFERFIAAIVGGFIVLAALLVAASMPVISQITKIGIFIKLLPYLGMILLIFVLFEVVSPVHPKVGHALIGAVITSIIWSIGKGGFDWYIATFTNVRSVYGTLGAFPILMIWLYFTWLTILFGMEIVAYLSGRTQASCPQKDKNCKLALTLTLEKQVPGEISKEIKSIQSVKNEIDNKTFMKFIQEIVKPAKPAEVKKSEDNKDSNEFQEK